MGRGGGEVGRKKQRWSRRYWRRIRTGKRSRKTGRKRESRRGGGGAENRVERQQKALGRIRIRERSRTTGRKED